MAAVYVDRVGKQITVKQWRKLQDDDAYRIVKRYSNEKFYCEVQWEGRVVNADAIPTAYWPVYRVIGGDVVAGKDAKPTIDVTFPYEPEALKRYEDVLVNWTDSYRCAEDGTFVETGNVYEPPPPPQPIEDRPAIQPEDNPDFGSW